MIRKALSIVAVASLALVGACTWSIDGAPVVLTPANFLSLSLAKLKADCQWYVPNQAGVDQATKAVMTATGTLQMASIAQSVEGTASGACTLLGVSASTGAPIPAAPVLTPVQAVNPTPVSP